MRPLYFRIRWRRIKMEHLEGVGRVAVYKDCAEIVPAAAKDNFLAMIRAHENANVIAVTPIYEESK